MANQCVHVYYFLLFLLVLTYFLHFPSSEYVNMIKRLRRKLLYMCMPVHVCLPTPFVLSLEIYLYKLLKKQVGISSSSDKWFVRCLGGGIIVNCHTCTDIGTFGAFHSIKSRREGLCMDHNQFVIFFFTEAVVVIVQPVTLSGISHPVGK